MKKIYAKPMIEIEAYELSASIASNCGTNVNLGPQAPGHDPCPGFEDDWEIYAVIPGIGILTNGAGTPFYNDDSSNCDCYYSSGGGVYFSS